MKEEGNLCGGLGDRHQQKGVNYTLDLNTGLTQVLSNGSNTYLYGNGRISQYATQTEYFLGVASQLFLELNGIMSTSRKC